MLVKCKMEVSALLYVFLIFHAVIGTRVILVENAPTCFRRVLAGRRTLRSFVRRVVPCQQLDHCKWECAEERGFHCESFNYKIDNSFRGQGLCELMTKPIEDFDVQRDFVDDKNYDFYEVDRNSLEPNCQETLHGSGMLHSGFLSSKPSSWTPGYQKPEGSWRDRYDYVDRSYEDPLHNVNYDDYGRYKVHKTYEDQFYVPYQIGVGRSDDEDPETWGQYGGSYGGFGTYYKNRNEYHKSINYWGLNEDYPHISHKVPTNRAFDYNTLSRSDSWGSYGYGYGPWKKGTLNNSGGDRNGLDYGESNYYKPKPYYHDSPHGEIEKDCSSRRRPGMSLSPGAIRRSVVAHNVVECEAACFEEREFKCVSYSYRYSSSAAADNCFLSERPYRGLEMSADSESDVYAISQPHCTTNKKPLIESECFWHVRSGTAISEESVLSAITAAGLGACEAECIRAQNFFCRGFSFRYDGPTIGDDIANCLLTSSPPTSLEVGRGLRPSTGHEMYARGNYGRGCEPALYDDLHNKETQCYLQYDSAAKLLSSAVKGHARVKDELACGTACTDAPFRCLSFSFSNEVPPDQDNCLLSEIRLFDLQRGVDYEHSAHHWLFAFDLFNGHCWRKIHHGHYDEHHSEIPRPIAPTFDEHYPVSGPVRPYPEKPYLPEAGPPSGTAYPSGPENNLKPVYLSSGPGFRPPFTEIPQKPDPIPSRPVYIPSGPSKPIYLPSVPEKPGYLPTGPQHYPIGPIEKSFLPKRDYGPSFLPLDTSGPEYLPKKSGYWQPELPGSYLGSGGYEAPTSSYGPPPSGPGNGHYTPNRPSHVDREEPISVSWRHYTVSGLPCRRNTACAENKVAGHWACEPEGGEIGSWDYCCAPTHRCGYSDGFHKPWCYVGPSSEQWRPCSEKYYPYHQHNIPHPSQSHGAYNPNVGSRDPPRKSPRPGQYLPEEDRRYWDQLYKNGPQAYYDKYGNPLPGYSRVPMIDRPHIQVHYNQPQPGSGHWVPVNPSQELDPPIPGGLGVPRYWPVAYLHKGPPPNTTYFRYNETFTPSPNRNTIPISTEKPKEARTRIIPYDIYNNASNITTERIPEKIYDSDKITTTTSKADLKEVTKSSEDKSVKLDVETIKPEIIKEKAESENIKGIDGKLEDFSKSIEVLNIEDVKKGEKSSDLKTLEAEERQIEAIGRLLASRRGTQLLLEKRSQKDLEAKHVAIDKDLVDFNFGEKFSNERKGLVQKVTKEEIENERNIDKSLEVSETTYVRPPRVLSTTENIRKAIINGKIYYDATIRESLTNSTRKSKSLRLLEESKAPSVINNNNFGKKKIIRARNVNPVKRVRRVYRRKYNPNEVRRRLLDRERSAKFEEDNARKP